MGIVKFGANSLNIEQVPDGHIIISESQFNAFKNAENTVLSLRSRIPAGTDETQITTLIEKGQQFDSKVQEINTLRTQVGQKDAQLQKYANLPQDFTVEKWNEDRTRERNVARQAKIDKLSADVDAKVKEQWKYDVKIDPRFINQEELNKIDLDAPDAFQKMYDLRERAYDAQTEFLKSNSQFPSPGQVGSPAQISQHGPQIPSVMPVMQPNSRDGVTDAGIKVAGVI